jgi:hypothetical protein
MSNGLKGTIVNPNAIYGKSAYEIAVAHGFNGTEEEWLESLKAALTESDMKRIAEMVAQTVKSHVRIGYVELLADKWVGETSPYSQEVTIDGVTENTQVDLTPSISQLVIFYNKNLTFVTENVNGVVTVYAIGQKPENDYVMQATVTEVNR